ncbi:efflux RND transporter periplasmic adaptor subunit [Vibrio rotiferianus]|uniref:efflux RND transporter periplasmic adaptor subunit n=1 Tax=Vibrio rotiferianus TaxID=190895 RepID=UPI00406A977A
MKKTMITMAIALQMASVSAFAVDLIGKTTSIDTVNVTSEVSGIIETSVWKVGDKVSAGDELTKIKSEDFSIEVDKKKASVANHEADLAFKKSNYARYIELREKKSISQHDMEEAKSSYFIALASLKTAKIELEKAKLDLKRTKVNSKISGYIISSGVDAGTWVNQGDLIYKISNIDKLTVRLLASEFDITQLSVGQNIQVWSEANPSNKITAQISRIGVELDPETHAYPIEVDISNLEHMFKPDMSIHATTDIAE